MIPEAQIPFQAFLPHRRHRPRHHCRPCPRRVRQFLTPELSLGHMSSTYLIPHMIWLKKIFCKNFKMVPPACAGAPWPNRKSQTCHVGCFLSGSYGHDAQI